MKSDWNGDGKHNWQDTYIDEKLSSGDGTSSGGGSNGGCMTLGCSTFLLFALIFGIVNGTMDVENPYTFVFAGILILIICYCASKKE